MDKEFFTNNRKRLFGKIDDCSMAILLSGSAPSVSYGEYEYKTNKNFFYFTGLERENFTLILLKNGNKSKEMLFIERPDPFMEKWLGPRLKKEEVQKISGIEQVYYNDQITNMINRIMSENKYDTVYLNLQRMSWNSDEDESQKLSKQLLNKYPYLNIKNIYPHIAQLRMIKAKDEVDCLKEAINITKEGIYNMMKNVVPGMKDRKSVV